MIILQENIDKIISIVIVIGLFIIASEGLRLRDHLFPNNALSHTWHTFNSIIRLLIVGIFYQSTQSYLYTILYGIIFIVGYSIICAIATKKKHWYGLSNKGVDLIIRKCLPFINFD